MWVIGEYHFWVIGPLLLVYVGAISFGSFWASSCRLSITISIGSFQDTYWEPVEQSLVGPFRSPFSRSEHNMMQSVHLSRAFDASSRKIPISLHLKKNA